MKAIHIPGRAISYMRTEKGIERRKAGDVADVSWKLGGGGFTSTPADFATFCVGLLQTKLVSKSTEQQMWTVAKPTDPGEVKLNYGLGFFVIDRPSGSRWVGHDGSQAKARTAMLFEPESQRGVVLMTNSEWVDPMPIGMALMEMIK